MAYYVNKLMAKHKEEKKYIVNKKVNSAQGLKAGRNVRVVDRRYKADTRNQKLKKKSKGGKGLRNAKVKAPKGRGKKKV